MTAIALADASRLSPDQLLGGLLETLAHENDLFKLLGFYRSPSPFGFAYNRLKTRPTVAWIGPGGAVTDSAATFEDCYASIRTVIGDVKNMGIVERLDGPKQMGVQLGLKASALARAFMDQMVNGSFGTVALTGTNVTGVTMATVADWRGLGPDGGTGPRMPVTSGTGYKAASLGSIRCTVAGPVKTLQFRAPGDTAYGDASIDVAAYNGVIRLRSGNPNLWIMVVVAFAGLPAATATDDDVTCTTATNQIDGLVRLVDPLQLIDPVGVNGDNCTPRKMRILRHACKDGPGTQAVFVMNWRDLNDLQSECVTEAAGASVSEMALSQYGIEKIRSFEGTPILVCDDIGITETCGGSTDCSRVYCVALGTPGAAGLEENVPQQGPGLFGVYAGTDSAMAEGRTCAGLFAKPVGAQEASDNVLYRVGWDVGLVQFYSEALACSWGITPTP